MMSLNVFLLITVQYIFCIRILPFTCFSLSLQYDYRYQLLNTAMRVIVSGQRHCSFLRDSFRTSDVTLILYSIRLITPYSTVNENMYSDWSIHYVRICLSLLKIRFENFILNLKTKTQIWKILYRYRLTFYDIHSYPKNVWSLNVERIICSYAREYDCRRIRLIGVEWSFNVRRLYILTVSYRKKSAPTDVTAYSHSSRVLSKSE